MKKFTRSFFVGIGNWELGIKNLALKSILLMSVCILGLTGVSFAQYTQVTNTSGTTTYGTVGVTVTSSGTVSSSYACSTTAMGPYFIAGGGTYTFSFSAPASTVQIPIAIFGEAFLESVSFTVNGAAYPITSANIISNVTPNCGDNTVAVALGGNLTNRGDTTGIPTALVQLSGPAGIINSVSISFTGDFIMYAGMFFQPNHAPTFVHGSPQSLSVCQNSGANSINTLLAINDADLGQTETWTVTSGSTHGGTVTTVGTQTSTGGTVTPAGFSYAPGTGYTGTDAFTVQVSDGAGGTASTTINVTVNPTPIAGTVTGGPNVCAGSNTLYSDAGAANGTGAWSSSNTAAATVGTGGTVFGVAAGTAIISFTETSGFTPACGSATATAPVTVNPLPIAGTVSGGPNVCAGSSTIYSDAGAANGTGAWSSSNTLVATVNVGGTVFGASSGTAVISFTETSGFTPSCGSATASAPVTVNPLPVSGTVSGAQVCAGSNTLYTDAGGANGTGAWTSSNTSAATVGSTGTVFGVAAGTSNISFTVTSGFTPSCGSATSSAVVTVNPLPVAGTVSGGPSLCAGSTTSYTDAGGTNGIGVWSSSNTAAATVNASGTVFGVSSGTAVISFTEISGFTPSCGSATASAPVTVNAVPVAGTVSGAPSICAGSNTLYSDAGAANGTGVWSSSNTSAATVNAGGTVFGVAAGTSSIIFTVTSGFIPSCGSATSSAIVTVNPLPIAGTVSGGPNECVGSFTIFSDAGAANGSGAWSSSNTSVATINADGLVFGVSAGTANISFTETSLFTPSCGSAVSSAPVTVNPLPVAGTVSGAQVCLGNSTVYTDAGAANGTGAWSSSNTSVATVNAGGTVFSVSAGVASISFTVTSGFTPSCGSATASAVVTVNPLPVAGTVSGGPNVCAGSNTLYTDAGGANGTGVWSSGNPSVATVNASGTVFGVASGNTIISYTVTSGFTPSCGSAMTTAPVTVNPVPVAGTVSGGPNVCAGSSISYIDAGAANGTGAWSSSNTSVATVNASGTVFAVAAGTANISFTETSGFTPSCGSATASAPVTVNPLPLSGTVSGGQVCAGSSTVYTDAGAANGTGAWSSSNTLVATVNSAGTVFGTLAGTSIISFTVTSGFTPSCGSATSSAVVTVNPLPVSGTVSGGPNVCAGSNTLYTDAGAANGTGVWSSSNTSVATVNASGTVFGVSAGNANISFTETSGFTPSCGSATALAPVTVNPLPVSGTVSGAQVCAGSSTVYTDAGAANGTGAWSSSNTLVATVNSTGTVFGTTAGTSIISFTVTSGFTPSCGSATSSAVVTVNPLPLAGTVSGGPNVCAGSNTLYTDAGGANGTGVWSSSNTSVATVNAGGTVFGVSAGNATISFTETSGFTPSCGSATASAPVTVNPLPVSGTVSGAQVCAGSNTVYSDAGSANGTGVWSSSNTSVATVGTSGTVFGVSAGTSSISFTVTSGFTPSCGSATSAAVVTVNPLPVAGTVTGGPTVCVGSTTLYSDAGAANGTGAWFSTDTSKAKVNASGIVTGISAGTTTIFFVVTSGFTPSCFTASASAPITVNRLPAANTGNTPVCAGSTFTLTNTASGTWSSSNTSMATVTPGPATTTTVGGVSAGTPTVTFTLPTGCIATTLITVNALPVSGTVSGGQVCVGSSTVYTDAGAANGTGAWSSSNILVATVDASGNVYGVSAGTSSISFTETSGFTPSCGSATSSAVVTVNPLPVAGTVSGGPNVCAGSNTLYTDAGAANGTGAWSSSNTSVATVNASGTVFGVSAGNANISFTETSGFTPSCGSATAFAPVTVNPLPVSGTVSGAQVCVGSITVYTDAGAANGTGAWSSSNTSVATVDASGNVYGVSAGTSSISFTETSGFTPSCGSVSSSKIVTVNPLPISGTVSGGPNVCAGSNTLYSDAGAANGTGVWSSSNTSVATVNAGGTVFGVSAGSTNINFTVTSGFTPSCGSATSSAPVAVNPLPIAGTVSGPNVCVGSTSTFIDAGAANGTGVWSSSNTSVATVGTSGTVFAVSAGTSSISFTVTSGFTPSCGSATASAPVTVNPLPVSGTVSGGPTVCSGFNTVYTDIGAANGTGAWSSSNTLVATVGTSGTVFGVSAGTANISFTVTSGFTPSCGSVSSSAALTVNPSPSPISSGYACIGEPLTLTDAVTGGTWISSNTAQASVGFTSGIVVGGILGATPTITYTLPAGCSITTVVTVSPLPSTAYTVTGGGVYCAGGAGVAVGLSESATGINYQLYNGPSPIGSPIAGSFTILNFGNQTSPGSYTVLGTNATTGCYATMTGSVTVSVNPLPTVFAVSGGGTACAGSGTSYPILVGGSSLGVNYQLYKGGIITGSPVAGTGTVLNMGSQTAAGNYTVIATNATTSCTVAMSGSATITLVSGPPVNNVLGTGSYCAGGTGIFVGLDGSVAGISYQLYLGGVATGLPVVSSGGAFFFGLETTAGTYTVIATNTTTGCSSTMAGSAVVTITSLPSIYSVTGGGGYCPGGIGVHVGLNGSATGVTYTLYTSGTAGTSLPGTGVTLDFGLQTTSGVYTVIATSGSCASTMSGSVTVTVNPLPVVDTVTGGGSYCTGSPGVNVGLNGSSIGTNYNLYDGGTLISAAAGTGFPINFGLETLGGTYTATATTTVTGCSANMAGSATVTVNSLSLFTVTGGGTYCTGGTGLTVGLSGSTPGITYQLLLGGVAIGAPVVSIGGPINFGLQTATGTYTVLATNFTTTCLQTMTGSATISLYPLPLVRTVTGGGSYCIGGTGVHVGVNISDLGINYQLYRTTAVGAARAGTGSALDYGLETVTGTYTVIATNPVTTCSVNLAGSAVVTTNPLPAIYPVTLGGSYCIGGTGVPVGLGNSVIGVNYQLLIGGVATGIPVPGTGSALSFGLQTTAGVYTVQATNATTLCNANMAGSATVTINPLPTAFTVTGGGGYCTGGAGVHVGLSSSTGGVNYQLYVGGIAVGLPVPGTGSALDFGSETTVGTYTVIATNTVTGCVQTMTGSVTVSINPLPASFAVTGGGGYCFDGVGVPVGLSNSTIGVNYQLYSGGLPVGPPQPGLGYPITFGLQTGGGSYTVVATITATGCGSNMTGSVTVTVNPLPSIHSVTGGGTYCTGGTGTHIGLNGSDTGISYQLYHGVTAVGAPVTGTGVPLDFGLQTLTGNYTVVATNTTTSCTNNMSGTVNVSLTPLPVVYSVAGGGSYCSGGAGLSIGISGSNTGVTYQLVNGTDSLGILAGTGLPLDFGLQTLGGTYTVVATSTGTSCANNMSGAATIIINPLPIVDTVTGGGNYCIGGAGVSIGLNGSEPGNTYELYYGTSPVGLSMAGTGAPLDFGTHLAAGTYTIQATVTASGCNDNMAGNATIRINPLPVAYTVTGGGNYCSGGSGVAVGLTSSDNGVSYQLYNGVMVAGSPVAGTGSAISFGMQTAAGVYTVVATNDTTFCTKNMNGNATITINPLPFAYTVTGGGSYCTGGTGVSIGLSGSDIGISYQLQNDGGAVGAPIAGTGAALNFGLQTVTGPYTIVATNSVTGCTSGMSGSAIVSYSPVPAIYSLASATSFYCIGGSGVDVGLSNSDVGTNYQLYIGSTPVGSPVAGTGSLLDLGLQTGAGTYTVIATNAAGCTSEMASTVSITVNLPPIAYTVIGGGSYCAGGAGVHIGLSSSTNAISYQLYNGIAAVGSPVIGTGAPIDFGLQTAVGVYTVIATNGLSTCVSTMTGSVSVAINPLPGVYTVTGGGNTCMGSVGLNVGLSGSDAGNIYKLYYGGAALTTMPGTGAPLSFGLRTGGGDYTVVAENSTTGCTNNMAGSADIVVNALPTPYVVTGGGNFCAGGSGLHVGLLSSNVGVNYQLYVGSTAVSSAVAGTGIALDFGLQTVAGTYTVVATNTATSCINNMTGSVSIGINPLPVAYGVIGGGNYCAGGTGVSIGLANSITGVSYQLMYGSATTGPVVVGTGSAINFGLETGTGSYTVVASDPVTACSDVMLGSATVGITALVAPSVTLSSGVGDTICAGTIVSVAALAANGGSTPTFVWYVNGLPTSATGSTYVSTPSNGDSISVVMTSSAACATPASVAGYLSRLVVYPHGLPTVAITASPGNRVCQLTTVNYVASTTFGGVAPMLSWTVNGHSEGIDSTYSYVPGNDDVVMCTLTSDYNCRLATTVSSNMIAMTVDAPITPSITVGAHPGAYITPGEYVLISAVDANPTVLPTYQWYINGALIPGATDNTYTNNNFMDMDSVSCVETSGGACPGLSGSGFVILHFSNEGVAQVTATNADIKLVPNPNNGVFTIKGTLGTTSDEEVSLEITDMLGQAIYKDNIVAHGGNINEKIQLGSSIANGMYILNVRSAAGNNVFHVVIEQ